MSKNTGKVENINFRIFMWVITYEQKLTESNFGVKKCADYLYHIKVCFGEKMNNFLLTRLLIFHSQFVLFIFFRGGIRKKLQLKVIGIKNVFL